MRKYLRTKGVRIKFPNDSGSISHMPRYILQNGSRGERRIFLWGFPKSFYVLPDQIAPPPSFLMPNIRPPPSFQSHLYVCWYPFRKNTSILQMSTPEPLRRGLTIVYFSGLTKLAKMKRIRIQHLPASKRFCKSFVFS